MNLLQADRATQLKWLLNELSSPDEAAMTDRAFECLVGVGLDVREEDIEDMLEYPADYDLGNVIRELLPETSIARVEQISEGARLQPEELKELRRYVAQRDFENDGGVNYAGFVLSLGRNEEFFVGFAGPVGAGGSFEAKFFGLFQSLEEFRKKARSRHVGWVNM